MKAKCNGVGGGRKEVAYLLSSGCLHLLPENLIAKLIQYILSLICYLSKLLQPKLHICFSSLSLFCIMQHSLNDVQGLLEFLQ
ncbi:hypothetical protein Tsubulata_046293, partial [Turnera subulata]